MGWFVSDPIDTFKQALRWLEIEKLKTLNEKGDLQKILQEMDRGEENEEENEEDYLYLMFLRGYNTYASIEKPCDDDDRKKIVAIFNYLLPYLPIYQVCKFWDRMRRFERSKGCNIQDSLLPFILKNLTDEEKQLLLKEIQMQRNDVNKYLDENDIQNGQDKLNFKEFDENFNDLNLKLGGQPLPTLDTAEDDEQPPPVPKKKGQALVTQPPPLVSKKKGKALVTQPPPLVSKKPKTGGTRKKRKSMRKNRTRK
jgi:hypothetical protein